MFLQKLKKAIKKNKTFLCVGLDSEWDKIKSLGWNNQFLFNKFIIKQTFQLVCSYKLNTAFYEAIGYQGIKWLKETGDYLKATYPEIPIIIDAKRGDIGHTNEAYASFIFDHLNADAVTVNPYVGEEGLMPFLKRKEKGIIILCKTSNQGSTEFQDLELSSKYKVLRIKNKRVKLYQYIAYQVAKKWDKNNNCLLVVGATYPRELKEIREIVGDKMWFLVPGVGSQGGDLETVLRYGLNSKKEGLIINVSRSIIFAKEPEKEAKKMKQLIFSSIASLLFPTRRKFIRNV